LFFCTQEEWNELVGYLNGTLNDTLAATSTNNTITTTITMPPVEPQPFLPPNPIITTTNTTHEAQDMYFSHPPQQQQYNNLFSFDNKNQTSPLSSMSETARLLRENSTGSAPDSNTLAGLLNQSSVLVHNATLPSVAVNDNATVEASIGEQGMCP
jgi:hypothetical protein